MIKSNVHFNGLSHYNNTSSLFTVHIRTYICIDGNYNTYVPSFVNQMLNKNTPGVKKVRGQSEAALEIGMYDQKL